MRKHYFQRPILVALLVASGIVAGSSAWAWFADDSNPDDLRPQIVVSLPSNGAAKANAVNAASRASQPILVINGTQQSETFTVNAEQLLSDEDISLTTSAGFSVSPTTLPYDAKDAQVTVTLNSTLIATDGQLILRSGDTRTYITLKGIGTPLERKVLSSNPAYTGDEDMDEWEIAAAEGFNPTDKGYTIEFKVKTDNLNKEFTPYAVTGKGAGFQAYVNSAGMGLYNATGKKSISNPITSGGTFYNEDKAHTYRFAVTSDERVFVYRDGLPMDTLRIADFALQSSFMEEADDYKENLLKNPGFEGEWNFSDSRNLMHRIEGWDVVILDQYNSTQKIINQELDNEQDFNNHALQMNRYMWSDGWSAAEIAQIVNVAPNETYSFSALAKGGIWKGDNKLLGSLRIQELQDKTLGKTIEVTSNDFETYAADYTTSANCKQLRVLAYLERAKWGASVSALVVDNMKLTGIEMKPAQKVGFVNKFADVEYFTYDITGAYAPADPQISASVENIYIDGTGNSSTFTVSTKDLQSDEPVSLTATSGYSVEPTTLAYNADNATVKVTLNSTLLNNSGQLILRSGDTRTYIQLRGKGTELETKDISQNPAYSGDEDMDEWEIAAAEGFNPTDKGYTIEFKVKTDNLNKEFTPYAVTNAGVGFQAYVNSAGMGLYNATGKKSISNPITSGGTFYNEDKAHTYRFAVTSDERVFVYRDGIGIDTLRVADFALQSSFMEEAGEYKENLFKNPGFEGEWARRNGDSLTVEAVRIEGWDVVILDQYNSTQKIINQELDNEQDFNNHALQMNRYMWSDGWSAAEIAQIVNVAPNETYSFSALAKGGIWKGDNKLLGSLRIQELQDKTLGKTIEVTSDDFETYAADYTTSANCKQLRVLAYLERAKWGASVSALVVDNMKLTGIEMKPAQKVGFINKFADVEYFTYDITGAYAPVKPAITASVEKAKIEGTDNYIEFAVNAKDLQSDETISLTATSGFSVSPATLPYNATNATVRVTLNSTLVTTDGQLILRSGDTRTYIPLKGIGTPLERKVLSSNPAYTGDEDMDEWEIAAAEGFNPTDKGYTIEFKVKTDNLNKEFTPYAVTGKGAGFQAYVNSAGMGLYNATGKKSISNPITSGGTFYNEDKAHTYRFAVTSDERVFVYRDGLPMDTLRIADFALQSSFMEEADDYKENLLKNPGFEGEWNFSDSRNIMHRIEGWDVVILDQYNSTQKIINQELDNEQDFNNHALQMNRYMWSDGWSAAEIAQIVNVAPNETYSFSALAKGGIWKGDNKLLGSLRIQELQDKTLGKTIEVTSNDFETYAADYTTSANCKQLRVLAYLERAKWGASVSALVVDNMKLTGIEMKPAQKVGFVNKFADVEYFTYDITGAYAPLEPQIQVSAGDVLIDGTNQSIELTVNAADLQSDEPISLTATSGFSVSPATLASDAKNATVKVTLNSTLAVTGGQLILRSGDTRTYVKLTGVGSSLERKNLSQNPIYSGDEDMDEWEVAAAEGFNPTDKGYTIEFKVKTDNLNKEFTPYAVTNAGVGFQAYVNSAGMGLYNATGKKSISNPITSGGAFYNEDKAHTYRFAITQDERVFVYRDGIGIDTLRVADFALQSSFMEEAGEYKENLFKNPGFEGEWAKRNGDSLTTQATRIEGWDVVILDQYNSTQEIINQELDNEQDFDNHALKMNRYMWSDGWSAAEIAQIVNVAPNETYSFSALAKGGIWKGDNKLLGSLRIQELQDKTLGKTIEVTSDDFETYAADYTTSANCKQLRVLAYLERAKWGASVSALVVDNMKLTGIEMKPAQKVGFINKFADVEYFTYDITGAYAPLAVTLSEDVAVDVPETVPVTGRVVNGRIVLAGISEAAQVSVYNTSGLPVAHADGQTALHGIALTERGIYICVVADGGNKQSVKVIY